MKRKNIYFYSLLWVLVTGLSMAAVAKTPQKPTAASIVTELESLYLKGEGVVATFSLGSEKEVFLMVALQSPKYRLQTSQELVVNDGTMVHRLNKARNEVVLDYAKKKNTAVTSPVDLFNFSSNYTVKLVSAKENMYTVQLTPKASVAEIFKTAEISNLTFELRRAAAGKPLQVVSITAAGKGSKKKITNVMIAPMMKFTGKEFDFATPEGAKVIDLTEE